MITDPQGTILALFLAFCRIGACVMVLPGFSSGRVPQQVRILVAAALSMAVLPVLWDVIYPRASQAGPGAYLLLVFSETLIGMMYGMMARLYTLGLQFAGTIIGMSMGFSSPGGQDPVEDTSEPALTTLITFCGLMILFMLDFHHYIFRALVDSYSVIPLGGQLEMRATLISFTDTLQNTTYIMLRLASPFLLYGLLFQISIGFVNKLAPQIPVYFVSTPYLMLGGLFMFYLAIARLISQFADAFLSIYNGH